MSQSESLSALGLISVSVFGQAGGGLRPDITPVRYVRDRYSQPDTGSDTYTYIYMGGNFHERVPCCF